MDSSLLVSSSTSFLSVWLRIIKALDHAQDVYVSNFSFNFDLTLNTPNVCVAFIISLRLTQLSETHWPSELLGNKHLCMSRGKKRMSSIQETLTNISHPLWGCGKWPNATSLPGLIAEIKEHLYLSVVNRVINRDQNVNLSQEFTFLWPHLAKNPTPSPNWWQNGGSR